MKKAKMCSQPWGSTEVHLCLQICRPLLNCCSTGHQTLTCLKCPSIVLLLFAQLINTLNQLIRASYHLELKWCFSPHLRKSGSQLPSNSTWATVPTGLKLKMVPVMWGQDTISNLTTSKVSLVQQDQLCRKTYPVFLVQVDAQGDLQTEWTCNKWALFPWQLKPSLDYETEIWCGNDCVQCWQHQNTAPHSQQVFWVWLEWQKHCANNLFTLVISVSAGHWLSEDFEFCIFVSTFGHTFVFSHIWKV